jgi:hypothetical protein
MNQAEKVTADTSPDTPPASTERELVKPCVNGCSAPAVTKDDKCELCGGSSQR